MWQGQWHGWSVVPGVCGRANNMGGVWCLGVYVAGPIKMGGLWYMRHVAGPIKMGGLWYMRHVAGPMAWVECGAWGGVCGRGNKNGGQGV